MLRATLFAIFLFALVFIPLGLTGADWCVATAPAGSDSNAGREDGPWGTILNGLLGGNSARGDTPLPSSSTPTCSSVEDWMEGAAGPDSAASKPCVSASMSMDVGADETQDTTPPMITLSGANPMTLEAGTAYYEPGYYAEDNVDGNITYWVVVSGWVNYTTPGTYTLRYNVRDSSGNAAEEKTRTVKVVDTIPPVITLYGDTSMVLQAGTSYSEPGYTATDNCDGNITWWVTVSGYVYSSVLGSYTLRYNVKDSSGNPAEEKIRTVNVVDTTAPVIALSGDNPMTLEVGNWYVEPGYSATDNYDGDITSRVFVTGSVDHRTVGSYKIHYSVTDSSGNPAQEKTRTVNVVDRTPPVITLLGDNTMRLECATSYSEPGYTATDNYDGDMTLDVVVTGTVDHTAPGSYTLRYNVKDSNGNAAEEKIRVVTVVDITPPVIVLAGDNQITLEVGTPYIEPRYTATDNCEGDVTSDVVVSGSVDPTAVGSYTLRYNVTDWSGNYAEQKTRTINIVDTTRPVITLSGDNPMTLEVGTWYTEPGYGAIDNGDGDITSKVFVTGSVDHRSPGRYTLYYNVTDSSGNVAEQRTRTVNVVDTTPPVITLEGKRFMVLDLGTPYVEPGYVATDNYDYDLTWDVVVTGSVDHTVAGTYLLYYNVVDSSANPANQKTRTVKVVEATVFDIVEIIQVTEGGVQVTWVSQPGASYSIWSCSSLARELWHEETTVESQGRMTIWSDPDTASSNKFYKVQLK